LYFNTFSYKNQHKTTKNCQNFGRPELAEALSRAEGAVEWDYYKKHSFGHPELA